MKIDDNKTFNRIINPILVVAIIVAIIGFYVDVSLTCAYGGCDLRNRVVGARCLLAGLDPYYFKWTPDMPEYFLDPFDENPPGTVSLVGVPPTVLLIHSTIARLGYRTQRYIWFGFQWTLFVLSVLMLSASTKSRIKTKIVLIIALLFISGSHFWRLHVERGQVYIVYVFLVSLAYWVSQRSFKHSSVLGSFLLGLTASLRPPIIFMSLPMLLYRKWKMFLATVAGLFSGVSLSLLVVDISMWKNYVSAMRILGKIYLGLIETVPGRYNYNPNIEGQDRMANWAQLPIYDSSLQYIFRTFLAIDLYPIVLGACLVLVLLALSFLVYKWRVKNVSVSMLFLIGISMSFISEFFIPAWCYSYNNILWLIPLSLVIINANSLADVLNPLFFLPMMGLLFSISSVDLIGPMNIIGDWSIAIYGMFTSLFILRSIQQSEKLAFGQENSFEKSDN